MSQFGLGHQVGQGHIGIGSGHEVGPMILQQVLLHALSHTAQHADNQRTLALDGTQCLQTMVYLLFGIIAHRTSIQKYSIGLFQTFTSLIASHLHY